MQTICQSGHLINSQDENVLNTYLLDTPEEWAEKALTGMINEAVKTIFKDYMPIYRATNPESIQAFYYQLIPILINLPDFQPYQRKSYELDVPNRTNSATIQIWPTGFSIEDWEKNALDSYYENIEQVLNELMENKIAKRRKAFVERFTFKLIEDENILEIPSNEDAFIDLVVTQPWYKTRQEEEDEL